jgi:hypothetical protein
LSDGYDTGFLHLVLKLGVDREACTGGSCVIGRPPAALARRGRAKGLRAIAEEPQAWHVQSLRA